MALHPDTALNSTRHTPGGPSSICRKINSELCSCVNKMRSTAGCTEQHKQVALKNQVVPKPGHVEFSKTCCTSLSPLTAPSTSEKRTCHAVRLGDGKDKSMAAQYKNLWHRAMGVREHMAGLGEPYSRSSTRVPDVGCRFRAAEAANP